MKVVTTAILFIATFVVTSTCVYAEKSVEVPDLEQTVNASKQPYLFFLEQNGGDGLIIYEQWQRKSPDEPSMLTVMRIAGGKSDLINFRAKVEALKDGVCSFRILEENNDASTVTKAKELLGIKTNSFDIHFRNNPNKIPMILVSVKDSNKSEQAVGGNADPASG